jgi:hypothetical protein
MIYIFRPQPSSGAVALAEKLTALGHPAKKVQEINRLRASRISAGQAKLVCWGGAINGLAGLNNVPLQDKLQDAIKLAGANVPTIEIAREQPVIAAEEPQFYAGGAPTMNRAMVQQYIISLQRWLEENPAREGGPDPNWLGRLRHHVGGNDLLNPPARPDFWVRKMDLRQEIRVHVFGEVSIRAGQKIPRAGVATPHKWIRSWDGGWMISYDGTAVRQAHRDLAKRAIAALGLTFGAVDLGITAEGNAIVLEVNRAPGLEGNSITTYANAIVRHFGG